MSQILGIEKFFAQVGCVGIFFPFFLSHSIEIFRRGTLLRCVSEKFMVVKKLLYKRGNHAFAFSVFCLAEPKHFAGDASSASLLSIIESFSA